MILNKTHIVNNRKKTNYNKEHTKITGYKGYKE